MGTEQTKRINHPRECCIFCEDVKGLVVQTECGHVYHFQCLNLWLTSHDSRAASSSGGPSGVDIVYVTEYRRRSCPTWLIWQGTVFMQSTLFYKRYFQWNYVLVPILLIILTHILMRTVGSYFSKGSRTWNSVLPISVKFNIYELEPMFREWWIDKIWAVVMVTIYLKIVKFIEIEISVLQTANYSCQKVKYFYQACKTILVHNWYV